MGLGGADVVVEGLDARLWRAGGELCKVVAGGRGPRADFVVGRAWKCKTSKTAKR